MLLQVQRERHYLDLRTTSGGCGADGRVQRLQNLCVSNHIYVLLVESTPPLPIPAVVAVHKTPITYCLLQRAILTVQQLYTQASRVANLLGQELVEQSRHAHSLQLTPCNTSAATMFLILFKIPDWYVHVRTNLCFLSSRDMPLLKDAAAVNASFNALPKEANGFPANATLQKFLAANFGAAGSDFESAVPDDFSAEPDNFLPNVTDPAIRKWALQVNGLWQDLCREVLPASMPLGFTNCKIRLASQHTCPQTANLACLCPASVF